jgi:hypothetical protein
MIDRGRCRMFLLSKILPSLVSFIKVASLMTAEYLEWDDAIKSTIELVYRFYSRLSSDLKNTFAKIQLSGGAQPSVL